MNEVPTILILTHGRPNKQLTLNWLRSHNYSGKIYLVLDNTDSTIQQYIDIYGTNSVIIFNKNHYINTVETISNSPKYKCILYAKCAAEDIARELGLNTFVVVDDDVLNFRIRFDVDGKLKSFTEFDISQVFTDVSKFMVSSNLCAVGCAGENMARSGSAMFTSKSLLSNRLLYNCVFRNCKFNFDWQADYLEDVVSMNLHNIRGNRLICLPMLQCSTAPGHIAVVSNDNLGSTCDDGGMGDTYKEDGFLLLFRGVIAVPTNISIRAINKNGIAQYQCVKRKNFPQIISDVYRRL